MGNNKCTSTKPVLRLAYYTIAEVVAASGGKLTDGTVRAAITRKELRVMRPTPGCNSPILISEAELNRWLNDVAGQRQLAPSPSAVAKAQSESSLTR